MQHGYANFQFAVPVTGHTRFLVASMTKTFTAILILQLVVFPSHMQQQLREHLEKIVTQGQKGLKWSFAHYLCQRLRPASPCGRPGRSRKIPRPRVSCAHETPATHS
ncbi:serine hydrolase [Hymenobacter cellulosilyticus]|uniref:serine hydrolase n=1 Tax=Hymenobacter cellulosilyticus TaxID=2932248 RepID=UPI0035CAD983